MVEIVNVAEVARIAGRIEPEPGHAPLLDALRRRTEFSERERKTVRVLVGHGGPEWSRDQGGPISKNMPKEIRRASGRGPVLGLDICSADDERWLAEIKF